MPLWSRYSPPMLLMLLGLLTVLAYITDLAAAEIKILTPRSIWTVLNEIGPEFERASGSKLKVDTGIAATLADRIIAGESSIFSSGRPCRSSA